MATVATAPIAVKKTGVTLRHYIGPKGLSTFTIWWQDIYREGHHGGMEDWYIGVRANTEAEAREVVESWGKFNITSTEFEDRRTKQ